MLWDVRFTHKHTNKGAYMLFVVFKCAVYKDTYVAILNHVTFVENVHLKPTLYLILKWQQ